MLVLATNGPGSMMGFDYARTENDPVRIGSANGIVNVGGFVASLITILLIGLVLSARLRRRPGQLHPRRLPRRHVRPVPDLGDRPGRVILSRRRLRAARGVELDPFHRAVVRVARDRGSRPR